MLKLNPNKCDFFRNEVYFLGHKCTSSGILPDPSKLYAVKNYPRPISKEETKRFTAFANYYRRFIENFSGLAQPLNALTAKKAQFTWIQECENAFQTLKNKLITSPVLAYPDFEKKFKVIVDASEKHCGAVLCQDHHGHDKPITYISRTFKKGELNKPIIEKELLAIHFAITVLRPYLYGRHFSVYSDHKPLIYLYKLKNPSSKLTRIRLDLEEYTFDITHIAGKDNVVADALSRIHVEDIKNMYEHDIYVITRSMSNNAQNDQISNNKSLIHEITKIGIKPRIIHAKMTKISKTAQRILHTYYSEHIQKSQEIV